MAGKKRRRPVHLHVMVSEEEQELIQERMAQAGILPCFPHRHKSQDMRKNRFAPDLPGHSYNMPPPCFFLQP
jgi:hypothetical protein